MRGQALLHHTLSLSHHSSSHSFTFINLTMHLSMLLGLGAAAVTNAAEARNILYYDQ